MVQYLTYISMMCKLEAKDVFLQQLEHAFSPLCQDLRIITPNGCGMRSKLDRFHLNV